jgi:hypothetical protein
MLLIISAVIFISSLSENLEFIVHNEETLLTLCFVAFIFFAYSYLGAGIFDDFQKSATSLEERLFSVISERFKSILVFSSEFSLMKGVATKFAIVSTLLSYRIQSDWVFFSLQAPNDAINSIYLTKLASTLKLENQIIKTVQDYTVRSVMAPLMLSGLVSTSIAEWNIACFIKPLKFSADMSFFSKVQKLKSI